MPLRVVGDSDGLRRVRELGSAAHALIERLPGPVRRISLRVGDCLVEVDWHVDPAAPPQAVPEAERPHRVNGTVNGTTVAVGRATAPVVADPSTMQVRAPLVGTFYRCPGPGELPFVEVGSVVEIGQQVAIIEAMKLLTPVTATSRGRVLAIHPADGEMVEYDQPLLDLGPADN